MLIVRISFHERVGFMKSRMLRVRRSANEQVVFTLSGRMDEENIAELETLIRSEAKRATASRSRTAQHTFASGSRDNDAEVKSLRGRWRLSAEA